jgi:hypothetical protein
VNHRGGTAWYGFGTGLVHPENTINTIIINGHRVGYTGTLWRPYVGVPHPKPLSAAFVAPVGGLPLIELFREVPNRPGPFRTINCFSDVFRPGQKNQSLRKPNQADQSLLTPSNILGVLRLLLFNPGASSRHPKADDGGSTPQLSTNHPPTCCGRREISHNFGNQNCTVSAPFFAFSRCSFIDYQRLTKIWEPQTVPWKLPAAHQ